MIHPQILALGKFSAENLIISTSPSTRKIDPTIENQLDALWEAKVKLATEKGLNLYNGVSYRLNSFKQENNQLLVDLGTIEYKVRDGLVQIPEYFNLPSEYYRNGCYTGATVKTADGHYLMVELSGKSMNPNKTDLIGGILETPPDVEKGQDIFNAFLRELEEEAVVKEDEVNELYLRSIYLDHKTNIAFHFEVSLKLTAGEILERFKRETKDQDIKTLLTLTRDEYLKALQEHNAGKQLVGKILSI
jgi:hypothetical protein